MGVSSKIIHSVIKEWFDEKRIGCKSIVDKEKNCIRSSHAIATELIPTRSKEKEKKRKYIEITDKKLDVLGFQLIVLS